MNASGRRAPANRFSGPASILNAIWRIPSRLHDRKFWYVQALVLLATSAHYFIEISGYTNPFETLHSLAISLYIIPLLYAALAFGWEGAILTGIWAAILTSPSTWIWHHSQFHWFGELGQVIIPMLAGIVVAWRVEREAEERERAETTSAELSVLNDIGGMLSYSLDVEHELPAVLRRLAEGVGHRAAWLCVESESPGEPPFVDIEPANESDAVSREQVIAIDEQLKATQVPALSKDGWLGVRLLGEGRMLGSIGVVFAGGTAIDDEERRLLTTVASQIGVAVENARSYRQRQESLQSYARNVTRGQEDERLRIARELHDETAQALVQIIRKLEEIRGEAPLEQRPAIDDVVRMTGDELRFVRRFARDLRPPVLDVLGLPAAVEVVVNEANERLAEGAKLTVEGEPRRLEPSLELVLFRIAQEAVRNVEKHASARSVQVGLQFKPDAVHMEVRDDGKGFSLPANPGALSSQGKLGLLGMKERAELVGGTFTLTSAPGDGTRISVEVPATAGSFAP